MKMTLAWVAQAAAGQLQPASAAQIAVESVGIDTRHLPPQALFVALSGAQSDGHAYLAAAQAAGAAAALVARPQPGNLPQVIVPDPAAALWQLAAAHRRRYQGRMAAITGSNGKTTVKEMLHSIAAAEFGESHVLRTPGNFNNHLGVPLTLLQLNPLHQVAILEAGMDHAGELTRLSALIQPQVALINNAQRAHIGHFKSLRAVAEAKGELLSGLSEDGCAVLNADDEHFELWRQLAGSRRILSFGHGGEADWAAAFTADGICLGGQEVRLQVLGEHNKMNALAAAAAADALQLPHSAIMAGLAAYRGVKGRLMPHALSESLLLIDDTYNANPDSAAAARAVLAQTAAARQACPVMVMGDMLALGEQSEAAHRALAADCQASGVKLLGVGACMQAALPDGGFGTHEEAVDEVVRLAQAQPKLCVLVKGSRGMRMEVVKDALLQKFAAAGGH